MSHNESNVMNNNKLRHSTCQEIKEYIKLNPVKGLQDILTKRELETFKKVQELHHRSRGMRYPLEYLAVAVGYSRATVKRHLAKFVELGLMEKTVRTRYETSIYKFWEFLTRKTTIKLLQVMFITFMAITEPIKSDPLLISYELILFNQSNSSAPATPNLQPLRHSPASTWLSQHFEWQIGEIGVDGEEKRTKNLKRDRASFFALLEAPGKGRVMLDQLNEAQSAEVAAAPSSVYSAALKEFTRELNSGKRISSQPSFFMSIFRRHAMSNLSNSYQRPKQGPRAEWIPPVIRVQETDFEFFCNVEKAIHAKALAQTLDPHFFEFFVNPKENVVTLEEYEIGMSVHQGCQCRARRKQNIQLIESLQDIANRLPTKREMNPKEDLRSDFDRVKPYEKAPILDYEEYDEIFD
jgi:hypothetical protein